MTTIEKRPTQNGSIVYRVQVRRKGVSMQTATVAHLCDVRHVAMAACAPVTPWSRR
jgi:hypothetical protein